MKKVLGFVLSVFMIVFFVIEAVALDIYIPECHKREGKDKEVSVTFNYDSSTSPKITILAFAHFVRKSIVEDEAIKRLEEPLKYSAIHNEGIIATKAKDNNDKLKKYEDFFNELFYIKKEDEKFVKRAFKRENEIFSKIIEKVPTKEDFEKAKQYVKNMLSSIIAKSRNKKIAEDNFSGKIKEIESLSYDRNFEDFKKALKSIKMGSFEIKDIV